MRHVTTVKHFQRVGTEEKYVEREQGKHHGKHSTERRLTRHPERQFRELGENVANLAIVMFDTKIGNGNIIGGMAMPRWVIGFLAGLAIWGSALDPAFAGQRAAGDEFTDCEDCPVMVAVPAGRFTMGSPKREKDRQEDEGPLRKVKIGKAFGVGKFEVTRGQYAAFVVDGGYAVADKCWTDEEAEGKERSDRSFRNPGYEQTDDDPVVCVSWDDAQAYVKWLSRKTGATYRLLSESEWEYAARAGSQTRFSFGDADSQLCDVGNGLDNTAAAKFPWLTGNSCTDGYAYTAPVGSFAANDFALYDMHGNVWEWAEDCYHDSYRNAPLDEASWTTGDCKYRVVRGGGSGGFPPILRSANRLRYSPNGRYDYLGFRVARTLTP